MPPQIGQLKNLQQLMLLQNKLTGLPPEIGQLTNLKTLSLSENQLTALPSEIGQLRSLTSLYLYFNKVTSLPPEIGRLKNLTKLILSLNQLASFPPDICQLTNLKELYLNGNPLISPPPEIIRKGIEAIRQYFAALKEEEKPLNEVKVLLVGDGAAGKTSLVNQLVGKAFNKNEDTTLGINIQDWEQDVGRQLIKINLWDFGGQVIQHATHQFFLSKRSLYIVVLDGRKDEQAEYWLRYIEAFGGGSPVLIVLNKKDENASFDVNRPFLLEKYSGIKDFCRISCKTGDGIDSLKKKLLEELAQVPMLEIRWPMSWFRVKELLRKISKPYLSSEEYEVICEETGITEQANQETLVDFLNDLGVVVHFQDIVLKTMHVLNPVWVTDAVYKIITAEKMVDSNGVLYFEHLKNILPCGDKEKCCCPPDTHPFIIGLMKKFELCYPIDEEAVLIPQLLGVTEPEFTFDYDGSLRFALHYPNFLPPSVFPRFMVKVYKDIEDNLRWRTGVVLADKQHGVRAVIKADVEARRINLWVQGERRREYLHHLWYLIASINQGFEKLRVSERVPMPDAPEITASYDNLMKYAERGISTYIPEESNTEYSVHELLGLVQPKDKDALVRVAEKASPQDTITWVEMLNETIEPKWTVPIIGITLNLKGFFGKLLARQKQKRQQSRK